MFFFLLTEGVKSRVASVYSYFGFIDAHFSHPITVVSAASYQLVLRIIVSLSDAEYHSPVSFLPFFLSYIHVACVCWLMQKNSVETAFPVLLLPKRALLHIFCKRPCCSRRRLTSLMPDHTFQRIRSLLTNLATLSVYLLKRFQRELMNSNWPDDHVLKLKRYFATNRKWF